MTKPAKAFSTGLGAGVVGVLLILLLIAVVTAYSGAYDIAAIEDHTPFVRWLFMTTVKNSIERQASGIRSPEPFTDQMIAAGASEYQAMCQHCQEGRVLKKTDGPKECYHSRLICPTSSMNGSPTRFLAGQTRRQDDRDAGI